MRSHSIKLTKKYIKNLKDDILYIYDNKAILGIIKMYVSNPQHYETFLKENSKRSEETTQNQFLIYGLDNDKDKFG